MRVKETEVEYDGIEPVMETYYVVEEVTKYKISYTQVTKLVDVPVHDRVVCRNANHTKKVTKNHIRTTNSILSMSAAHIWVGTVISRL